MKSPPAGLHQFCRLTRVRVIHQLPCEGIQGSVQSWHATEVPTEEEQLDPSRRLAVSNLLMPRKLSEGRLAAWATGIARESNDVHEACMHAFLG